MVQHVTRKDLPHRWLRNTARFTGKAAYSISAYSNSWLLGWLWERRLDLRS